MILVVALSRKRSMEIRSILVDSILILFIIKQI